MTGGEAMRGGGVGMALYVFLEYLAVASYHHYAPLFFVHKGFTAGEISLLSGLSALVAVAMQPLWGSLSDRARHKNSIHLLVLLGAAAALLLYAPARGFGAALGAAALFGGFSTSATPLGETILLEHLESRGKRFGPLRIWGTASFAVGVQMMGLLLEKHLDRFVGAGSAGFLLAAGASLWLPRVAGHQRARQKNGWRTLLRKRALLALLVLAACLQLTQGVFFSYFPLYFTGELGGGKALLGLAGLVAAAAEIPFLLMGDRLFARFGARKLVVCAGCAMAARWLLLGVLRGAGWAIATQALNGAGLIVLSFSLVKQIQQTVPAAYKARGQMLASMISFGLGRGLAGPAGWLLSKTFSTYAAMFCVMAALAMAATLCIGLPLLRMRERDSIN